MIQAMRTLALSMVAVAGMLVLSGCRSQDGQGAPGVQGEPGGPFVMYSVSGQAVKVISAKTPFDDNPAAREAFLRWFERGFETGLAGKAPLMVEWSQTPVAQAGRRGYDLGLEEGTKFKVSHDTSSQSSRTALIPPG
jgi:hypothetical protein